MVDLVGDVAQQRLLQRDRRNGHLLEPIGFGVAGDEVEDPGDVPADRWLGGEEGNVGVDLRGHRMVVAGAEMAVTDERPGLPPHHHRQLGVGLQLDEAVYDLRSGALEVPRPADIRLLVETRLQLDQRSDRFSEFRGLDQGAYDRAVGGGPIERLLDRNDARIPRRLTDELDDHVEGFVGMMDHEILLPDCGETIAAVLLDPFGKARIVRRKLQFRPVDRHKLRQFVQRQHPVDRHDAGGNDIDVAGNEGAQRLRHGGLDFQPDDRTAAAPLDRGFIKADEIFRLLLDLDVAVADDPEGALAEHLIARKKQAYEGDNQTVEAHETRSHAERAVGKPHEALDAAWNAHERAHRPAVLRI